MVEDLKRMVFEQGAGEVNIEVTFTPPWKPSEELREMLGVYEDGNKYWKK